MLGKRMMMKEIDLMIFDFDGTLADTGLDLANAVNFTLSQMGFSQKKYQEIIAFIGDGVVELIKRALGKDNIQHLAEALKIFGNHYGEHLLDSTTLYDGVSEVLSHFHQKKKIVMTNKRYEYTVAILRGLNIEKNFVKIIGDGSTPYRKPDRRLIDFLLTEHNSARDRIVIIGDGVNDVKLAKNSGILSCGYLNGLGNREELIKAKADYYCENISEIKSLFC